MMKTVSINNFSRPLRRPCLVNYGASFICQLRGLTFRRKLDLEDGLLLVQKHDNRIDSAIHMLFVFIPLAVVWINSAGIVVDRRLALPWRLIYVPRAPAKFVLEVHPDRLEEFCEGDYVRIEQT